jgi:hypothetical protein
VLYVHVSVCALALSALVATDVLRPDGRWFGWWPLVGWGMGLTLLALVLLSGGAVNKQLAEDAARNRRDHGDRP